MLMHADNGGAYHSDSGMGTGKCVYENAAGRRLSKSKIRG